MKKLLTALLSTAFFTVPAYAQKTNAQLQTEITVNFPDNSSGAITPQSLRTVTSDIATSATSSTVSTFTQAGTGAIARVMQDKAREILSVTDFCSSAAITADATACTQLAINQAQTIGGATIYYPPGTYNYTTCPGTGYSLSVTANGIYFVGASGQTVLNFTNSSCDDFRVGYQSGQIAQLGFSQLYILHSAKVGGSALNFKNVATVVIDKVTIDSAWNGVYAEQFNTMDFRGINITVPVGSYAAKLFATAGTNISTLATFENNSNIFCNYHSGTDGLIIDGPVYTTRTFGVALTSCRYDMRILNTAASSTLYPQFGEFHDLEADGASSIAVSIEAGSNWTFVAPQISNTSGASGQGSADTVSLNILPDTGNSVTRQITITGGRIDNAQNQAALINAKDIAISGTIFTDGSKSGSGNFPMVEFGAATDNVNWSGGISGALDGISNRTSYGAKIDSGATNVNINSVNLQNNVTGPYTGSASSAVQIYGGTSGSALLTVALAAGTPTVTLGSSSGTPAVTASSPLVITTATGNIACSTCLTTASTTAALATIIPASGNLNLHAASGSTMVLGAGATDTVEINSGAIFSPSDGGSNNGAASNRWAGVFIHPTTVSGLPACGSTTEGTLWPVTDSNTNTWGATIAGSSTNHVLAYCNGSAWTVTAK